MRHRASMAIALILGLTVLRPPSAEAGEKPASPPKRVLVELYTSQGCNSCPPASDLLGNLFELGDGADRIVPLNFHVDYFNQPWPDPYSDASYTRRQRDYNSMQHRDDLQFTPLLMVDGREPLVGSDRAKAVTAIKQALRNPPEVALDVNLDGTGNRKTVRMKIAARSPEVAGRELLIGVALTEDPVTTKVRRGENAGLTLVEHHVVRRLDHKFLKLDRTGSRTLTFPIELPSGRDGTRFRVTVFAQNRANGKIYQAHEVPWIPRQATEFRADRARDLDRAVARRKARRVALNHLLNLPGFDFRAMTNDDSYGAILTTCPSCGSLFNSPTTASNYRRPGQGFPPVVATC
jgi:hypothetical protein